MDSHWNKVKWFKDNPRFHVSFIVYSNNYLRKARLMISWVFKRLFGIVHSLLSLFKRVLCFFRVKSKDESLPFTINDAGTVFLNYLCYRRSAYLFWRLNHGTIGIKSLKHFRLPNNIVWKWCTKRRRGGNSSKLLPRIPNIESSISLKICSRRR